MSTRSDIIVHMSNGKWARVYCHWDGYPSHNGKILFNHYNTQKLAEKLIKHGDMSYLDKKCGKPKGHSYDTPVKGYTVYYGRDRGETETNAVIAETLQQVWPGVDTWTEYTYVWDDNHWSVGNAKEGTQTLRNLKEVLEETNV